MISKSLADTKKAAEGFAKDLISHGERERATLVGLYGDLGSGKTAFTQAAAKVFGIAEITSPTFIIERIYEMAGPVFKKFVHIDAYRLDSGEDLKKIGFDEVLKDPETLVFLEWPERVADILPDHIRVMCRSVSENEREYEMIFPDEN